MTPLRQVSGVDDFDGSGDGWSMRRVQQVSARDVKAD